MAGKDKGRAEQKPDRKMIGQRREGNASLEREEGCGGGDDE